MTSIDKGSINYRDELLRKMIHLCSLSIPIIYNNWLGAVPAAIILGSLTLFALVVDLSRYFLPSLGKLFYSIFGFMLREHERDSKKKNLNGATYVLLSAFISILVFPKIIFVAAFTILIISDTTAALVGRKIGKHKFLLKSLEGTLAFFISAIIVVLLSPKASDSWLEYLIGIIAAFIGAIVENISFGFADDNFSIPISIGMVMWLLYYYLLPNIHLSALLIK